MNEELKAGLAQFEANWADMQDEINEIEAKRKAFLKKFPKESLPSMKITQYVLGYTDSYNDSFCYWIEQKLNDLGNIHGAAAKKFGIYYGKEKSDPVIKYRFAAKFGDSEQEAYENVKKSIIDLLDAVKNGQKDMARIKNNKLSPMFKGKILYVYYPDLFLNIFADEHLNHFLDSLGISYGGEDDEADKREKLLKHKQDNPITRNWSTHEYAQYLYDTYNSPNQKVSKPLQEYIEPSYPSIDSVNAEFCKVNFGTLNKSEYGYKSKAKAKRKVIDFERENRANAKAGIRGEYVVYNKEVEYLNSIKKYDLAKKVSRISDDPSLGYDILSFDDNGKKKYIEVKSTKSKLPLNSNASFIITQNEYNKANEIDNYYIYMVFEVHSNNPKIVRIFKPFSLPKEKLNKIPKDYRVSVKLEK